jgi:hypothetical protein
MNTLLIKAPIEYDLNWTTKVSEGGFTSDDLINAYIMGVQDQVKHTTKILEKKFNSNLCKAQNIGAMFFDSMVGKGFDIKFARLKFYSIESYKIILFVSEELYLSDKILALYNELSSLLLEVNNEKFHLSFSIMFDKDNLNEKRLLSDGYLFCYGKQQ